LGADQLIWWGDDGNIDSYGRTRYWDDLAEVASILNWER